MAGKVIAMLQKKGGATKTTTAINLLGALIENGYSAVLADMDKDKPDALLWADFGTDLVEYVVPLFDENPTERVEELKSKYDFVIIDTPPNFEAAALKAALLCDLCIIPCNAAKLEKKALLSAAQCAIMAKKPYRFLGTRVVKNTILAKKLIAELEAVGGNAFDTFISNSIAMQECQDQGTWIGKFMPGLPNHIQFKELAKELLTTLEVENV